MSLLTALLIAVAAPAQAAQPVATVTVDREATGWTADYRLGEKAPVWVFADSIDAREEPKRWRQQSWTVVTPGVRLERRGWYDVLLADSGNVPERVTIRFEPFVRDIEAAYDAALGFSDGTVALYDQKFKLFPAPSAKAVETYPIDPSELDSVHRPTRTVFRDHRGPVFADGRSSDEAVLDDRGTYVLFGPVEPAEQSALLTHMDSGLPGWLSAFLTESIPAVLAQYAEALGPAPGGKPVLLVSWGGPRAGVTSMGGSVLPSMMVMAFEGEGLLEPTDDIRQSAMWFAAHEGAHFWLGQAVGYERPQDGWITEGGADLLATRAVARANPAFDARKSLQSALDSCLTFSNRGGVASANERDEHKAYYHCGAVFGLVAERAWGGDFATFVRHLVNSNSDDGRVSRSEWLAAVEARVPGVTNAISRLLDGPADSNEWAALLRLGEIPHSVAPDGTITLD